MFVLVLPVRIIGPGVPKVSVPPQFTAIPPPPTPPFITLLFLISPAFIIAVG
jgi:hypothetical protein